MRRSSASKAIASSASACSSGSTTILKERGETFRSVGAQDVQSYRRARPNERMPRLLLVVDEFQEFFVEDDTLSAAANLLLDRLVRQGRAFGIHVLLGSQTLGGAYSLARSTLGQVAVRIALQCSESDAHLILSEENAAARLLTRPGEAIYNDSNGLARRQPSLSDRLAAGRPARRLSLAGAGDIAARPGRRVRAGHRVRGKRRIRSAEQCGTARRRSKRFPRWRASEERPAAWKRCPSGWASRSRSGCRRRFVFNRRPGDNLLIVGPDAPSAQGMLAVAFITLAAQQKVAEPAAPAAQFYRSRWRRGRLGRRQRVETPGGADAPSNRAHRPARGGRCGAGNRGRSHSPHGTTERPAITRSSSSSPTSAGSATCGTSRTISAFPAARTRERRPAPASCWPTSSATARPSACTRSSGATLTAT